MMFLRALIATTLISAALAESIAVHVKLGVQSTPNELNTKTAPGTQDRLLYNVILTGLDRPNGILCSKICDISNVDNCVKCGELPESDEKASYMIHFLGITMRTIEATKSAMTLPINNLFGAENVELIDVQKVVAADPVYGSITVTTTLQQLVADRQSIIDNVDKVLGRTDSSCIKICEEEANICHKCTVDTSSVSKKLIMVVWGRAKTDADLNRLSLSLYEPLRVKYPTVDLKTDFSFTRPQLPRVKENGAGEQKVPSTPNTPPATPPVTPPSTPIGSEQVLVIKLQITIELSSLTKNSEELAKKLTIALGGSGGAGCTKICEVQKDNNNINDFIISNTCYQCNGQPLTRDGKTLEAKRWEITILGRAAEELKEYNRVIVGGVTNFVNSIGGTLNAITVTPTGKVVVPNNDNSDERLSGGAIAGIVIGCVVVVALITVAVYCLLCKKDTTNFSEEQEIEAKSAPDATV
eukprot:TRINITY_DN207_c1_g1_i1.p1 TRINITY_DN207_c1_g1~~TRINITY_DN207_c1_g1_i1.p1  ORF type:complete len:483 (+),score=108.09 TRINITY_DN207_c1_g1_i1:45-1451(+)